MSRELARACALALQHYGDLHYPSNARVVQAAADEAQPPWNNDTLESSYHPQSTFK